MEKVIAEAPEVFLQIFLSLKFEYCIIEKESWAFVVLFFDIHLFESLRQVSFDDFEAFAFALEDGSRYKLKIKLLVEAHRIAVMACSEDYVWTDQGSGAVACELLIPKFDDSHGRIGILIYLLYF